MTVIKRKRERPPSEPRSSEEIRYLYIEQLHEELQRLQDEADSELDKWLMSLSDEDRQLDYIQEMIANAAEDNRAFEVQLFDAAECTFVYANVFAFRFPKGYALTKTTLELLEAPDVVWAYPQVSAGLRTTMLSSSCETDVDLAEWDDHLVIEVLLVDG